MVTIPPTHFFLCPPVMGTRSSSLKMKRDFSQHYALKITIRIIIANPAKDQSTNTIDAVLSTPSY